MTKNNINRKTYTIDAQGQSLGRLASQIALILRGKNQIDWQPNVDSGDLVRVKNASQMKITGKKLEQKIYYHHSGYPGGLKEKKMSELMAQNPGQLLQKAVWNMLPKNKLRAQMIKRLKIES